MNSYQSSNVIFHGFRIYNTSIFMNSQNPTCQTQSYGDKDSLALA